VSLFLWRRYHKDEETPVQAVVSDSRLLLDTKLATCDGQPANFENWQDLGIRSQVAAAEP